MTISDIPNIVEAVCIEPLITKTYAEIMQFKKGLSINDTPCSWLKLHLQTEKAFFLKINIIIM